MARSPLALESVVCAACGAKVREDRVKCLRCGQPLVAASAAAARRSATLNKLLAAGAGLAAAGLIGLVVIRPEAPVAGTPVQAAAASLRSSSVPVYPKVVTSLDARRPGEAAYRAGDIPAALEHFREAVDADGRDPEALNNLGQLLVRSHRAPEAIQYFDRAIAIVPGRWAYHFNRARAFAHMQQWSAAIAGYRDALQLFPDDYATHFNLAKALQRNGDLRGALAGFERAIQLAPRQADFHLSYGLALEAAQRPKDAAAAYRRYLELDEESPDADKVKTRIAMLDGA